jgi:hypothetical protein
MHPYVETALAHLANALPCGYSQGGTYATEPTSLAALALAGHGRATAARPALGWLASLQAADGSIGVRAGEATPCWPTALALAAWSTEPARYQRPIELARDWLLAASGHSQPRSPQMGHDSTLVGWPWVMGTHSWVEPTAWSVLALKAAGNASHPRTREAVRLLVDRLLPDGGCNYGNTTVLGQQLRPHLQPTGLILMALAGETIVDPRLARSLDYLQRELSARTPAASLSYGLLGMAAQGRLPDQAHDWLAAAMKRSLQQAADWKVALLTLAALGDRCPLFHPFAGEA